MKVITDNEILIRLLFFFGALAVVGVWEVISPRRSLTCSRLKRWPSNLSMAVLNTFILRLIVPTTAIGFAFLVNERSWGLLSQVDLSVSIEIILSVLLLDLAIYLQHVAFHRVPILWRVHRTHHADLDVDVSTGARFHPIEIIISMGFKFAVIALVGVPAVAILIFEVLLNATAMFNHGNIFLGSKVDRFLRTLVVTPDMHRIHHSIFPEETNSNFGFNLPWWDRMFGTYRPNSKVDQRKMTIGLEIFRDGKYSRLNWLLVLPFLSDKKNSTNQNSNFP